MPKPWLVDGVAVWPPIRCEFNRVVALTVKSLRSTDPEEKAAITAELKRLADNRRVSNAINNDSEVSTGVYVCGQSGFDKSNIPF